MELTDLNPKERYLIERMREDKKLNSALQHVIKNYYHTEEGEMKIKEFLDQMFESLDDFSEANLKAE